MTKIPKPEKQIYLYRNGGIEFYEDTVLPYYPLLLNYETSTVDLDLNPDF